MDDQLQELGDFGLELLLGHSSLNDDFLVSIKLTTHNQGSMVQRMDWTSALPDVEGSRVFGKRVNQADSLHMNNLIPILKDIRKANDFETDRCIDEQNGFGASRRLILVEAGFRKASLPTVAAFP